MKIDVFSHIVPKKYGEELRKKAKVELPTYVTDQRLANTDIEIRFRLMDRYPDVIQVLTVAQPPLETGIVTPGDAVELARIANDELAELVTKYPDKFIGAVACLPLTDIDAALKEADRAIFQLHLRGVQIFTNINGERLSAPKFRPLYEMMARFDLPIWIHPTNIATSALGPISASGPMPSVVATLGWPFETTVAMGCLVKGGIFKDYPNIKFITHHCGGMVPFFAGRIEAGDRGTMAERIPDFRKFYNDTALYGNTAALMCGHAYFGADHLLFGTDMPLGAARSGGYTLETIQAIEQMDVPAIDKEKIFEGNAKKLLRLTV